MNRLKNKVCVVIGAGQTLGETVGNGRATAIRFAREGGQIILVDKNRQSAHAREVGLGREGTGVIPRAMPMVPDEPPADGCRG